MVTEEGQRVSPSSREREYARRRYEDWQKRLADKRQRQRRQRRRAIIAGSAAAVVLVIGVSVLWLKGGGADDGQTALSPSASASGSPSGSASGSPSGSAAASPSASGAISASPGAGANPCPAPTVKAGTPQKFSSAPESSLAEGKNWKLTIKTTCGDVVVTLDGAKAPKSVANAIFLSGKKFWDGSPCHRLGLGGLKMLQCGDPTGTGTGGPGYQFGPVENAPADGTYKRGVLAMARSTSQDSQGSQFFIVFGDTQLPGGYTVFGTVSQGLDIIDKVAAGGVSTLGEDGGSGPPARAISIVSTSVTPA